MFINRTLETNINIAYEVLQSIDFCKINTDHLAVNQTAI